jgi:hypothetical protein
MKEDLKGIAFGMVIIVICLSVSAILIELT